MNIFNLIWREYADSASPSAKSQAEREILQAQLDKDFTVFKKEISKEQFKLMLRMEVNYNLLLSLDDEKHFTDAFCLGANFMAQLLCASHPHP